MTDAGLGERLTARSNELGGSLSAAAIDQLCAYFELLRRWNRRLSLTALPVEETGLEAIDRLLIEPVLATRFIPQSASSLVDIGSGGGSPALPLKILRPDLALTMVEAREKKAAFLREAVRQLSLREASVEACRYEALLEAGVPTFDVLTLRAVKASPSDLSALSAFLKPGGLLLIFATEAPPKEAGGTLKRVGSHPLLSERGSRLEILQRV